jgi:GAF domain-containing protein
VGTIRRDSDNATAAAFREARVHVVKGDVMTNGAIAVPLVTPGGCVGVMAAEVRHEREQTEETRALAAIVAAQLATLIGVSPPAVVQPQARAT